MADITAGDASQDMYDKLKAMFTTELGKTEITTLYAANRTGVETFFTDLEATFAEFRRTLEES